MMAVVLVVLLVFKSYGLRPCKFALSKGLACAVRCCKCLTCVPCRKKRRKDCWDWTLWRCERPHIPSADGRGHNTFLERVRVKLKIAVGFYQVACSRVVLLLWMDVVHRDSPMHPG